MFKGNNCLKSWLATLTRIPDQLSAMMKAHIWFKGNGHVDVYYLITSSYESSYFQMYLSTFDVYLMNILTLYNYEETRKLWTTQKEQPKYRTCTCNRSHAFMKLHWKPDSVHSAFHPSEQTLGHSLKEAKTSYLSKQECWEQWNKWIDQTFTNQYYSKTHAVN